MDATQIIATWGVLAIAAMVVAGVLAGVKNRNYSSWMAWAFLVPPAIVLFALLPRLQGPRPRNPSLDQLDKYS